MGTMFYSRLPQSSNKLPFMEKINELIALFFLAFLVTACATQKGEDKNNMKNYKASDYAKEWKVIDSLEQKGLPKSALAEVEKLYEKVKTKEEPNTIWRCLIYKSKYIQQLEEDGFYQALYLLQEESDKASFPLKPLLETTLAELYYRDLQSNQWQINQRTEIRNNDEDNDVQTWTMGQYLEKVKALHLAALQHPESIQTSIKGFDEITSAAINTDLLRPTLYDFLAHRAIDYFSNGQAFVSEPVNKFSFNQEEAFLQADQFIDYTFVSSDQESGLYQALLLFQDLLKKHKQNNNTAAFVDADIKRIAFVNQNNTHPEKSKKYLDALSEMSETYKDNDAVTEIYGLIAGHYYGQGVSYVPNPDDKGKDHMIKAMEYCEKGIQKNANSYGGTTCQRIKADILNKQLGMKLAEVNIPNQPFLALLNYKNVEKIWLRAIPIQEKDQLKFNELNYDKQVDFLIGLDPVKTWNVDLPSDVDYNMHNVELKIDGLPLGSYVILFSDNENFKWQGNAVGFSFTKISNLSYFQRTVSNKGCEFYVTDRTSGAPISNATIDYFINQRSGVRGKWGWNKKGTLNTDNRGYAFLNVTDNINYKVVVKKEEDVLDVNNTIRSYNQSAPRKYISTNFFLDRKIYRPGQTVYFKALMVEFDENRLPRILANEKVTVEFIDANYQSIMRKEFTTNAYGSVNGSFVAPRIGLLGGMQLKASKGGSVQFRVEEYKRPKFEVSFDPVKESYQLNDLVTITGMAKAYAGSVVDGAQVTYRVERKVSYPYFFWRRSYWRPTMRSAEIANGNTTTDAEGKFKIEFPAMPDESANPKYQPQFNYQITADITDITGETQSKTFNVAVGYIALNLSLDIPEQWDRAQDQSFKISSLNLNGEFEEAIGEYTIEKLQAPQKQLRPALWNQPDKYLYSREEFTQLFPLDAYHGADKIENWKVEKSITTKAFNTNDNKTINFSKGQLPIGNYRLTINTKDKYGKAVQLKKFFQVFDTETNQIAKGNTELVYQDQETYEVGDLAKLFIGTSYPKQPVLFQVDHQNQTLQSKWITIDQLAKEEINIVEKYRGNLQYSVSFVRDSRSYQYNGTLIVPWTDKELSIEYSTFRDKLLPGQEEKWQVKIMGSKKEKIAAELVAAMYDASLDAFVPNTWNLNLFPTYRSNYNFRHIGFNATAARLYTRNWNPGYTGSFTRQYRQLNWFNFDFYRPRYSNYSGHMEVMSVQSEMLADGAPAATPRSARSKSGMKRKDISAKEAVTAGVSADTEDAYTIPDGPGTDSETDFSEVNVRTNLNETVFFLPDLKTDSEGNVIIEFTMNEALTKWKFLLLAHTKDLKTGLSQKEVLTQKELMVLPNPPRFFREGDEIEFTAKISNLSESSMNGVVKLELLDAITNQPVDDLLSNDQAEISFSAAAGQSTPLSWKLKIPEGKVQAITHRVVAKTTNTTGPNFSDGEEDALPILINRMLVTETMALPVRAKQSKQFEFNRLKDLSASPTLQHHRLTLEYTSNPAWYAVQALPYLMEYPYDCTEQIFNRFYANSLATTVANAHPKIKSVFEAWKGTDALMSNLTKNQELKAAILEETPWVMDAQNEKQQKKNIGLLFDLTKMAEEQKRAAQKLVERQSSDGGFSWFPGGRSSHYITQYLVEGLGHLNELGVNFSDENNVFSGMLPKAIRYIDNEIVNQYKWLKKHSKDLSKDHLSNIQIHYLYTRSFFVNQPLDGKVAEAHEYYLGQAKKYWLSKGTYQQGMIALALHRLQNDSSVSNDILKSLKERSLQNEELGMYWKNPKGYYWYEHPIETQALMIEAFREITNDKEAVEEMRVWLLKNKQTTNWKTTKATAAAVYALLIDDREASVAGILLQDAPLQVSLGNESIQPNQDDLEAGTGYYKTSWRANEIKPSMADIQIKNDNEVIAWGGLYWQYFEQLDKITTFEDTPLQLKKQVYKETNSDRGPVLNVLGDGATLSPGDKLKVRIELRVDRDMEYVHMKDMRGSGFEPINVLSRYKYQDGLGYYESTKDVSTNFFIDYLPKGTYVFEYPLRVVHKGDFSNGITSIQCMYAPEFSSHSEGIRLQVK